jgi:hypothetical protein
MVTTTNETILFHIDLTKVYVYGHLCLWPFMFMAICKNGLRILLMINGFH